MYPEKVVLQVLLLQESLVAQLALVLVVLVAFHVLSHVTLQGRLIVTPSAANVANVGAGAVLGPHVVIVLLVGDEPGTADVAHLDVILQVATPVSHERPLRL